ncbi:MAG: chorismate synthase [Clostridiales bacterium]|nr:chorismate synthase [Clostridiales bacterium]
MSSVLGDNIRLSVFGESHGEAIGCVIDGLPAGIALDTQKIEKEMKRRAPGKDKTSTPRAEADIPHILSGVLNNVTTGAPLAMIINNTNTKSDDYDNIMAVPRPGHSDYPAYVKYGGKNDVRGGGHFSGRLTAPLVFAGAVAKQILADKGITIGSHILKIGTVCDDEFDKINISKTKLEALTDNFFSVLNPEKEKEMRSVIEEARLKGDSAGGIIECAAIGLPVGLGGNMFDTVESKLASAVFGVPAVKGIQFGAGFKLAEMAGSTANDAYFIKNGRVALKSNNNGGVLGGMATGAPLVFSVVIKPTPSVSVPQQSVNLQTMRDETLIVNGRHDPCIVPRALPVIEGVCAFEILDMMM